MSFSETPIYRWDMNVLSLSFRSLKAQSWYYVNPVARRMNKKKVVKKAKGSKDDEGKKPAAEGSRDDEGKKGSKEDEGKKGTEAEGGAAEGTEAKEKETNGASDGTEVGGTDAFNVTGGKSFADLMKAKSRNT